MTIPAVLFQAQSDDARGVDRVRVRLGALWLDRQPHPQEMTVLDISMSGILIVTDLPLPANEALIIELPDGVCKICRVAWGSNRFRGVAFSEPLSETEFQQLVTASVAQPSWHDEHMRQDAPLDHENRVECEPDYEDVNGIDKLPLATRARIIFGSAAILWAVFGSLTWSAIVAI